MRTGLLASLLFHAAAAAVAWVVWVAPDADAPPSLGASLHYREAPPAPDAPPAPPPVPPPPPTDTEVEIVVEEAEAYEVPEIAAPESACSTPVPRPPAVIRLREGLRRPDAPPRPEQPALVVAPPRPPAPRPAPPRPSTYNAPERVVSLGRQPVYPLRARRLGLEGRLVLHIEVAADGTVSAVAVAESSGHAILDEAALEAARTWIFLPARRDGRPEPGAILVPVSFQLR